MRKRKRRAVRLASRMQDTAMEQAADEPRQGPGVIRAETQRVDVHDYEELSDWRPGRVVLTVSILAIVFILVIALLISLGYGA